MSGFPGVRDGSLDCGGEDGQSRGEDGCAKELHDG